MITESLRNRPWSRLRGRPAAAAVIAVWLLLAAAAGPLAGRLASVQRNDATLFLPASAESTKVIKEQQRFQSGSVAPALVVYERVDGITEADRALAAGQLAAAERLPGVRSVSPAVASADGQALESVVMIDSGSVTGLSSAVADLRRVAHPEADLAVYVTGPAGLGADFGAAFKALDLKLLLGTTIVVVLVLLAVYRSPILWLVPLFAVGAALVVAQAAVYVAASRFGLPSNGQSQGILTVLVFGAGTDYALLVISRQREELRNTGRAAVAAFRAARKAAPAIVASGSTVILSLLCLVLSSNGANRSLGPTGAIGIAAAMLAMLTLLPAVLALAGRRLFWPRIPQAGEAADSNRGWARVAAALRRAPVLASLAALAVLGGLVLGVPQLRASGIPALDQYTVTVESVTGQRVADRHFPAGTGEDAVIVAAAGAQPAVVAAAQAVEGVGAVTPAGPPASGRVLLRAAVGGADQQQTVERLRAAVHAVPGAGALVGGDAAVALDTRLASEADLRLIVPLVLAVITLVLAVLLRSLVAPILVLATVVLSYLATLGICALAFRHVFHFAAEDPSFPLTAFVFLVALGVDYNIFLMSRVREAAARRGTREGVLEGLTATGGVITSAGVVLAATFAVFGVLPLVIFAEIGFAVAVGVLIDTAMVRTVLLPALALLAGRALWWPSSVDLPARALSSASDRGLLAGWTRGRARPDPGRARHL